MFVRFAIIWQILPEIFLGGKIRLFLYWSTDTDFRKRLYSSDDDSSCIKHSEKTCLVKHSNIALVVTSQQNWARSHGLSYLQGINLSWRIDGKLMEITSWEQRTKKGIVWSKGKENGKLVSEFVCLSVCGPGFVKIEFSLNVLIEFNEFSDKNICHYNQKGSNCHILC